MESESESRPWPALDSSRLFQFLQPYEEESDRLGRMFSGVPRQTPGWPADQLLNPEYCGDYEFDPVSGYTTATSPPESLSGSTVQPSSKASTVFSGRTHGQSSSGGVTSNPPRHRTQQSFVQFLQNTIPTITPAVEVELPPQPLNGRPPIVLWCEFCLLKDCNRIYRLDQTDKWIAHHCSHMGDTFPAEVMCWFCDHIPFVAASRADRRANYHARMQHIRGHIFDDDMRPNHMRPDFAVIEHMCREGLVLKSDERYHAAVEYSELPAALRLPGGSGASYATPRTVPLPLEGGGRTTLRHDLRKEKRLLRQGGHGRAPPFSYKT